MISKFEIGSAVDAARYHDKAFTQDGGISSADNYYLNEKALATWQGKGAEILGIKNAPVKKEEFVSFLEGRMPNPATGVVQNLADNSKGDNRRAGVDFTVSPPKSVSIVGLVGQDERVVQAHLTANARAMEWLEKHASMIRVRNDDGRTVAVQAGNLLYATVHHVTNRENEPQIHNHNVIVAAVYDKDASKWRSLTNDQLYKLRSEADVIYKAELGQALKAAGYELDYAKNGVDFEIAGFSREQLDTYSTRSAQIKEALQARGIDPDEASYSARQTAALDSRSVKKELPREALQAVWLENAQNAGLDVTRIVDRAVERTTEAEASKAQQPAAGLTEGRQAALKSVSWAIEHLSEREQSFPVSQLEVTAVKFSRGGLSDVEWAIEQHLKNHHLFDRGVNDAGVAMLTTRKGIEQEEILRTNIEQGKGKGKVVLRSDAEFDAALKAFEAKKTQETGNAFRLSNEQVNAAKNILMHADVYQGIQGEAGTGKTAALAMVREVAEEKGWKVLGVATSAAAAKELGRASGIESRTVASFFVERDNAIRLVKAELAELKDAIVSREALPNSGAARIESRRLHVKSGDIDFGEARYTFDRQRGEIFKSTNSLSNVIGAFFMDRAGNARANAAESVGAQESFADRLRAKALLGGATAAESLGRSLSTYEKVGTVEAIAARNTLYVVQDSERNALLRKYEAKRAELDNLERTGNREGKKTLLVMDESSLTGAADAARISTLAKEIGARVVFQGDIKQHGSVPAGRAFAQAQDAGMNTSVLEETRRFDKATEQTKRALLEMKAGRHAEAMALLDKTIVDEGDLAKTVAERYLANWRELKERGIDEPKVGVVAMTNNDRKAINAAIHDSLIENDLISKHNFAKAHLDDPKLTFAERSHVAFMQRANVNVLVFQTTYREIGVKKDEAVRVARFDTERNRVLAVNAQGKQIEIDPQRFSAFSPALLEDRLYSAGDRIEARAVIKVKGADGRKTSAIRIANGTRGTISAIDQDGATIKWDDGVNTRLDNNQLRRIDHAYAHTSYREQGATNDREIVAVSKVGAKIFNRESAYVSISRARDNTEIVTSDEATMLKNAGKDVSKTTAIDIDKALDRALSENRPVKIEKNQKKSVTLDQEAEQAFTR